MTSSATASMTTEERMERLESDQESLLHVLGEAVQNLELLRAQVAAHEELLTRHVDADLAERGALEPKTFQVPAPVSRAEKSSRRAGWIVIMVRCEPCRVVCQHDVLLDEDGLSVACGQCGCARDASEIELQGLRETAAQYLGAASYEARREARVQPLSHPRALEVLG